MKTKEVLTLGVAVAVGVLLAGIAAPYINKALGNV